MKRQILTCLLLSAARLTVAPSLASAEPPRDNPTAAYCSDDEGYPAWTDRIHWGNVIDMSLYDRGGNHFQWFENARDEVAAKGGGVLYYPAGTYDFTDAPMDGPDGRGLMLKSGVVIRGDAPTGKPNAFRDGKLDLKTKFVFGCRKVGGGRIPRDWGLIGLIPEAGQGLHQIDNVGVCWVHPNGRPSAPADVQATIYEDDAIRITWRDTSDSELGFRVERQLDGGRWHTIAYRPRQSKRHEKNLAEWIDFLAPRERELRYRVIACDMRDSDAAASPPTASVKLPRQSIDTE